MTENAGADGWMLQMETFDPHEPFHAPDGYRDRDTGYEGPVLDWPRYKTVNETPEEVAGFTKYVAEKQVDFSKDLEQLTAVRTADTSMMVIQVHPDQESYDR